MLGETAKRTPPASADDTDWDLFDACAKTARGALSANTERAMRSDLAIYAAWCGARGVPALPASAETLAAFVEAMARERAPATVRRYVASVAAAHRAMGLDEAVKSAPIRRALARMHRRKGRRQAQAEGAHRGAARAPARGRGRRPHRRAQPRAPCRRLRHAASARRARRGASVGHR